MREVWLNICQNTCSLYTIRSVHRLVLCSCVRLCRCCFNLTICWLPPGTPYCKVCLVQKPWFAWFCFRSPLFAYWGLAGAQRLQEPTGGNTMQISKEIENWRTIEYASFDWCQNSYDIQRWTPKRDCTFSLEIQHTESHAYSPRVFPVGHISIFRDTVLI
jgi:hypothetical protein